MLYLKLILYDMWLVSQRQFFLTFVKMFLSVSEMLKFSCAYAADRIG